MHATTAWVEGILLSSPALPKQLKEAALIARIPLRRRVLTLIALLLFAGFVLYPDPTRLLVSIKRLVRFPVDAAAVEPIARTLPNNYQAVENYALATVPWANAWKVYGMPWYFPTVQQVIADRAGDCQGQALLIASILSAKGMPYTIRYSFDHVWIDYPGKTANALEDPATSFVSNQGKGWLARLPDHIPLRSIVDQRVAFHWTPMPSDRKVMLALGLFSIFAVGEGLVPLGKLRHRGSETRPLEQWGVNET